MKTTYPFVDTLNRPSDKHFSQENGTTDNPVLFSGEYFLLKHELGLIVEEDLKFIIQLLDWSRIYPGLLRRNPEFFEKQHSVIRHNFSHDESNGLAFLSLVSYTAYVELDDMVDYLERHNNQYCDLYPGSDFFNSLKKSPISTLKKLKLYIDDIRANPQDTNSVDLRHDGDIVALASYRQPRDIAFWKLAANRNPSLFDILNLCIAMIITTRANVHDGSRGGTILLAWFRNLAIKRIAPKGLIGILLRTAMKIFDKRLINKYGKQYPVFIIDKYFDRVGPNGERHPLIKLVSEYLDLFPIA